ncbi:MAG TPA: hypothetical protein VL068_03785, partial [Microthrixaceae bacterium]|nr:hypothetical protein [Microthrixaceae bacterium]
RNRVALSERSRSALYQGFSAFVDEEAVQEMMSYFPARDVEEPVTKESLRAESAAVRLDFAREFADLRAEFADFKLEIRTDIADFKSEIRTDLSDFKSEIRTDLSDFKSEIRTDLSDFKLEIRAELAAVELRLGSEFRSEIRRTMWLNVGMLAAFAAVIIAAVRI